MEQGGKAKQQNITMTRCEITGDWTRSCVCHQCHEPNSFVNEQGETHGRITKHGHLSLGHFSSLRIQNKVSAHRRRERKFIQSLALLAVLFSLLVGPTQSQDGEALFREKRQVPGLSPYCQRTDGDLSGSMSFEINETASVGDVIGFLPILPAPATDSTPLTLVVTRSSSFVTFDPSLLRLSLAQPVNADSGSNTIEMAISCRHTDITWFYDIFITIVDANDNTPYFIGAPYTVSVPENAPVDSIVFSDIKARDDDGDGRNGQILFRVIENPNDPQASIFFGIPSSGRGEVWLLQSLDYETRTQFVLGLEARDNGQSPRSTTTTLTINVINVDDGAPQFRPCNVTTCDDVRYLATITEKTLRAEPIEFDPGPIQAVNVAGGGENPQPIVYSFTAGSPTNYMSYFAIDPVNASVTLLQPVRHSEYDFFVMEVTASKGSSVARATVIIEILEINEQPPTFLPVVAMFGYIYENSAIGTRVNADVALTIPLVIQATDPDLEPDEIPQFQYYTSDATNTFVLESLAEDRGYLILSSSAPMPLDAEERSNYNVSVVAKENNTMLELVSERLPIYITVLDRNDNTPQFVPNQFSAGNNRYNVALRENAESNSTVVAIAVLDADISSNPPVVEHNFVTSEASSIFSVSTEDDKVVVGLISAGTITASQAFIISLQATDADDPSRRSPLVYVDITVIPATDNSPPEFSSPGGYSTTAFENLPANALVISVVASDPDLDLVKYSIVAGNTDDAFMIEDDTTGEIRVQGALDREVTSSYNLIVAATDGNLTSEVTVQIIINDVNDERPEFNSSYPTTFLVAEQTSNAEVGRVVATDKDQPFTGNSRIQYSLESDTFRINAVTGYIFANFPLDREQQDRYELEIVASDAGFPPLSTTLTVTVIIQDINDNRPIFDPTEYVVDLSEDTLIENFLALQAFDRDSIAGLRYSLTGGNTTVFDINPLTGNLSLLAPLDFEMGPRMYQLEVTVTDVDVDGSNLTAVANVTVMVVDENDNIPEFQEESYFVVASRESEVGTLIIANITALDADLPDTLNGQVTYSFAPPSALFEFTDPTQGDVYTTGSLYNASMWQNLTVVATDGGDPANFRAVPLTILLQVENPVFPENVIFVNDIMEEQAPGIEVAVVQAFANEGDIVEYRIVDATDMTAFMLNQTDNKATVYTNKTLDREVVSNYSVVIQASIVNQTPDDQPAGSQRRKKRATEPSDPSILIIYVVLQDINDNAPLFPRESYYAGVSSVAGVGTDVIKVEAIDADVGANGLVTYSLYQVDQVMAPFRIDPSTGQITTTRSLEDQEAGSQFEYIVMANGPEGLFETEETSLKISMIDNSHRAILGGDIDPDTMRLHEDILAQELSAILGAVVHIEDVGQREVGNGRDPTGSDVLFFAINDEGNPLAGVTIVELLLSRNGTVSAAYSDIVPNTTVTSIRSPLPPVVTPVITPGEGPSVEAIALICLACVLFICAVVAISVIIISWKKREIEKEKAGRMYLPALYNSFNPYGNGDDMEMAQCPDKAFLPSTSNPVYYQDDLSIQPGDEIFPNGTPNFLDHDQLDGETQERTLEFGPEDEEGTALANGILAGTSTMPEDQLMKATMATIPGSAELESPSYSNKMTLPAYTRSDDPPSSFFNPDSGYTNHALSVDDEPDLRKEAASASSSSYHSKTNPLMVKDEDHSYTFSESSTPSYPSKSTSPTGTFDPNTPYDSHLPDMPTHDNVHLLKMNPANSRPGSSDSGHQSLEKEDKVGLGTPIKVPPPVVPKRPLPHEGSTGNTGFNQPNSDEDNTSDKILNELSEEKSNPPAPISEISSYSYTISPSSTPPNPKRPAPTLGSYDINPEVDIHVAGMVGEGSQTENNLSSNPWEAQDVMTTFL